MTHENFKKLLDELDGNASGTLAEKNAQYSSSDDALHNFKCGAEIMGGTPAQACWGYLTKHLVALRDMIQRNDFSNLDNFLEKIQDSINYLRFIWALGNEENIHVKTNTTVDATEYPINKSGEARCKNCRYSANKAEDMPCRLCKGTCLFSGEEYKNTPSYFQEKSN